MRSVVPLIVERVMSRARYHINGVIPFQKSGKHLFVSCFPKSGSTYLCNLLSEVTGYPLRGFVQSYGHNEQDLYEARLRRYQYDNTVTQQHTKGTYNNLLLIRKHHICTVVLTRNIYDVVMSLRDHIEREDDKVPAGFVHREYHSMEKDEKLMFVIRIMLPWYFSFLMSWREAPDDMPVIRLTYEELFSDVGGSVARILVHFGIEADADAILRAIVSMDKKNTRRNVGVSGRGAGLPSVHRAAILDLARCWNVGPDVMRSIGIEMK
jgi:sulfotransferase family protein